MKFESGTKLAILIASSTQSNAQLSGWQRQQVNTTICYWAQPRAAVVRDTVYFDGGSILWSPGLATGEIGEPVLENSFLGSILSYNLSESFSRDSNVTGILLKNILSKARGGPGNEISDPSYYDGGMLANDAEFFLYGGSIFKTPTIDDPPANSMLGYRQYAYGPNQAQFQKGFSGGHLDGVTRYISFGGAVNAPSENKAWYFSGLTSPSKGPIWVDTTNSSRLATSASNTLIELDMREQFSEKWNNITLPDKIHGRANPEVVWVPIGKQGILVVLGGVVYPQWTTPTSKSDNETESKLRSQEFMRVIDIYDIANNEWYQQPTEGGPGASTRGCAVVATAADKSSFNIYYYGGFDGVHDKNDFSDEVWVLSLPSFTWTLLNRGTPIHSRAGHKCFMPYPDQMMVFGGYTPEKGGPPICLDQGPVLVFNLTSGMWLDGYSPTKYGDYGVHEKITAMVGGTAYGGATAKSPAPSGWASKGLGDVFATAYDTKKLKKYWPYNAASSPPPGATTSPPDQPATGSEDHLLSTVLPAVLVPVAFFMGVGVALWWFCLRSKKSNTLSSASSTAVDESRVNIMMWIRGQGAIKRAMMAEAHPKPEMSASPDLEAENYHFEQSPADKTETVHHEMENTQVSELCDTSSPVELHDTGFTPISSLRQQFGFYGPEAPSLPSRASPQNGQWAADTISAASQARSSGSNWLESPLLGTWSRDSPPKLDMANFPSPASSPETRDPQAAASEEGEHEDAPVSPTSANENVGNYFATAGPIISPLGRTLSGETHPGYFHEN